jgi:hypothetical protein
MNATLCKNNLNSVKDVPMMYISGERKKKKKKEKSGITVVLPLILKCYYTEHPASPNFLLS